MDRAALTCPGSARSFTLFEMGSRCEPGTVAPLYLDGVISPARSQTSFEHYATRRDALIPEETS